MTPDSTKKLESKMLISLQGKDVSMRVVHKGLGQVGGERDIKQEKKFL